MCCHCGSGDLLGFASRLLIEMAHFCAFGCHGSIPDPYNSLSTSSSKPNLWVAANCRPFTTLPIRD
jgi:hypothetical protein